MGRQEIVERTDGLAVDDGVGIQEKQHVAPGQDGTLVVGLAEAGILGVGYDVDVGMHRLGEGRAQAGRAVVGRMIVHDDHLVRQVAGCCQRRRDGLPRQGERVVADDDRRAVHG